MSRVFTQALDQYASESTKIVYVKRQPSRHPEDCSWACPTEWEAARLTKFLNDLGITSVQISDATYNAYVAEWEADRVS